jgi:hypothetical protein
VFARLFNRSHRTRSGGQEIRRLDFEAAGGRRWSAIGGGASLAEAVAFARESLPLGVEWRLVRSAPLFGD